jgi:hypothetical protein
VPAKPSRSFTLTNLSYIKGTDVNTRNSLTGSTILPRKPQPTMGVMASKALAAKRSQQLEVEWENHFIKQAEALIEKKYVFFKF